MSLDFPPIYSICGTSLTRYYEYPTRGAKLIKCEKSMQNLTRGIFTGQISIATRKLLRKRLGEYYDAMYSVGQYYRKKKNILHPIITLTLPSVQSHSDNEIKKECLTRFIELMKDKYDVIFYYWVAEKQENENIHFHILIDRFVDWQWIRKAWNQRLEGLGYIDEFEAKHGHRNPNSTDVGRIYSLSKSSEYVTKYTSKVEQQGGIEGRLHGGSDILRELDRFKPYGFHEFDDKIREWIDRQSVRLFEHEHAIGIYGDIRSLLKRDCPRHYKMWQEHHRMVADKFYGNG